jgi:hypothetical protein
MSGGRANLAELDNESNLEGWPELSVVDCDMRKSGLTPVIDDKTEVLILGTLPSDISLAKGQYYANPANDFWKLIGQVLNRNVVALS